MPLSFWCPDSREPPSPPRAAPGRRSGTGGDDQSRCRLFGEDGHPAQLEIQQLAQALGQVERAALGKLEKQSASVGIHPSSHRVLRSPSARRYLAVRLLPVVRLRRGLQRLPGAPLVKGDDGAHVLLAEGAVDQRGDVDAPHTLNAVEVRKGLVGKIPARGGNRELESLWGPKAADKY